MYKQFRFKIMQVYNVWK